MSPPWSAWRPLPGPFLHLAGLRLGVSGSPLSSAPECKPIWRCPPTPPRLLHMRPWLAAGDFRTHPRLQLPFLQQVLSCSQQLPRVLLAGPVCFKPINQPLPGEVHTRLSFLLQPSCIHPLAPLSSRFVLLPENALLSEGVPLSAS